MGVQVKLRAPLLTVPEMYYFALISPRVQSQKLADDERRILCSALTLNEQIQFQLSN